MGDRPIADPTYGGSGSQINTRSRDGATWQLAWNMGFANWTWMEGGVAPSLFLGLGVTTDGSASSDLIPQDYGNAIVQLGVDTSREDLVLKTTD